MKRVRWRKGVLKFGDYKIVLSNNLAVADGHMAWIAYFYMADHLLGGAFLGDVSLANARKNSKKEFKELISVIIDEIREARDSL